MAADGSVIIEIQGDAASFKQALANIEKQSYSLVKELREIDEALELNPKSTELLAQKQTVLRKVIQETEQALRDLIATQKAIDDGKIDASAENYRLLEREISNTEASLSRYQDELDAVEKGFTTSANSVNALASALAAAGVAASIREIAQAIRDCVSASVEFESAMTGVFKTVDGTEEQLAAISDGIKRMSTEIPATTTEIAAVAEAAGQLGIATEDVLSFSKVMLDLGESTNLPADQAATALARFANITGTSAADYERLGSTIVALGNNFATTEAEITEMATRLASAGTLAGLSESQILSLAAAMSSVGINAEAGGTAMAQTLGAIEEAVAKGGEKLDTFAEIAGMSAREFSTAWEKDAISAVQAFISGIADLNEQGESAVLVLDDLGLSGVRQGNMIQALALASKTMAGAVSLANDAWVENTALAEEANKRYETTESKLAMMNNAFTNVKAAIGDALSPALKELAEVGTDAFTWAADFVERNPQLVQALAGVTAAVVAFAGGLTALSAAVTVINAVKTVLAGLGMSAGPILAVAGALSALAGVAVTVAAAAASAESASASYRELAQSVRESRDAYAETEAGLSEQADNAKAMVDAIKELAAVEEKTDAQKQVMIGLVGELNQAVPGLSLAYDDLSDSLSMSTADMRDFVQAMAEQKSTAAAVERMIDVEIELKKVNAALVEAQAELEAANAEFNGMLSDGSTLNSITARAGEISNLNEAVAQLKAESEALTAELEALEEGYDGLQDSASGAGAALEQFDEETREIIEGLNEALAAEESVRDATDALSASYNTLTSALEEQQEQGSLSLDTILELIDAGYAAALAVDSETKAVTLNKDAYVALTQVHVKEQLRSLEAKKAAIDAVLERANEAEIVSYLAESYLTAADAKDELEGKSNSYAAQIAALEELRDNISSYTGAVRSSSSAVSRAKTQAEKDLEEYKKLKAELDHQRALDAVSERDYYIRLKEYRDKYLTDEDNLDTYRKVTEEIYSYDKALAEQEADLWSSQTEALADELEKRTSAIMRQQEQMVSKLSDYGDLFTIKDGKMTLEDLQKQVDAVEEYGDAMTALRDRGVSASLMDEVLSMDVDEATQYAQKLLKMTDDQWDKYNNLWEEKQRLAIEVAQEFYKGQLDALKTEYTDHLNDALAGMTDIAYSSGQDTIQGLIDGLVSKKDVLFAEAQSTVDRVNQILSGAVAEEVARFSASLSVNSSVQEDARRASRDTQTAQAVWALSRVPSNQNETLVVNIDSTTFYRDTLSNLRAVEDANPRVVDD